MFQVNKKMKTLVYNILFFNEFTTTNNKGPSPNYRLMQVTIAEWTRWYPFRAEARHSGIPRPGVIMGGI